MFARAAWVLGVVLVGCSQTPPPACPIPVAVSDLDPDLDPDLDLDPDPDPDPDPDAATVSADGLYSCRVPSGAFDLTIKERFTARDLVVAYMSVTCRRVLLPIELADRAHKTGFAGRLKPADVEPGFRKLFEELGLAMVRERGLVVIADASWLAPRPGLILLERHEPLAPAVSSTPTPDEDADVAAPFGTPASPSPIDAGITVIDDAHRVITRAAMDLMRADPAVAKGARLTPSFRKGRLNGVTVYAVRPRSFHGRLGFNNGDTVHEVNGVAVTSTDQLGIDKLAPLPRIILTMTRRGQPFTLEVAIR